MAKFSKAQYEIITGALQKANQRIQDTDYGDDYRADSALTFVLDELVKVFLVDNQRFDAVEFRTNVRRAPRYRVTK